MIQFAAYTAAETSNAVQWEAYLPKLPLARGGISTPSVSSKLQLGVYYLSYEWRHLVNAYKGKAGIVKFAGKNV